MSKTITLRELNASELDAVSGAATHKAFDFTVAGVHVVGGYTDGGDYFTWAQDSKNLVIKSGKV
jgi:hypothetical protein